MGGILAFLTNRFVAPIVAVLGAVALVGCLWLYVANAGLRATVAEQEATLAAVKLERDNWMQQALNAAADLAEREKARAPRFNQAERVVRNAPSTPVSPHNLAVRDCLLALRGGGTCTDPAGAAPATAAATNR